MCVLVHVCVGLCVCLFLYVSEREREREIMLGAKRGNECMKQGEEEKRRESGSAIYIPTYYVNVILLTDDVFFSISL